jgi:GTP-binding protein HflX
MHESIPPSTITNGRLFDLIPGRKKTLIIGTFDGSREREQANDFIDELDSLCQTFGLDVAIKIPVPLRSIDAGTFIGKGKVEELRVLCSEQQVDVVVFDDEISPQQQRNLEIDFGILVIDRVELILGIFAARAKTKEASIQIELAECRYQLPRLKGRWSHLDRQGGGGVGAGSGAYTRGGGEQQIEVDRRLLKRRISQMERELEEVMKNRETQRRARIRSGVPTFAIVGYTNVGKSTLMHALTKADVLVEDKLFATLDTTTRKYTLPNNQEILLTDTVGFIRKLPHLLVAAFKSTLEEAVQADILLHLVDVSNPLAHAHAAATMSVLKELGVSNQPMIIVLNKVDQCEPRVVIERMNLMYPKTVEISALTGAGIDQLLERMIQEISLLRTVIRLRIPQSEYGLVSELMKEGKVLSTEYEDNDILLEAEIPADFERKVEKYRVIL